MADNRSHSGAKNPRQDEVASWRMRYGRPLLSIGFIVVVLALIEGYDPWGVSSSSTRITRDAINAISAPWYGDDWEDCDECGTDALGSAPETPQEAALVILIDDRTLRKSQETWPLPAWTLYQRLKMLAEDHQPAAVFLDVMLTHERPDPDVLPEKRENRLERLCDFRDREPSAQKRKYRLRALANLREGFGPKGTDTLRSASHPNSRFWCLKYQYKPVDAPRIDVNQYRPAEDYTKADRDTPVEHYGSITNYSKGDPRIPLIMAVPNPDVSGELMTRMIPAEAPGDFVTSRSGAAPEKPDSDTWRNRLLIPGLRGVATPAVVQSVVDPPETGTVPLRHQVDFDHPKAPDGPINVTTPAAAAVVAFCRHHSGIGFPGCEDLKQNGGDKTAPDKSKGSHRVDTLNDAGDWDWDRPLFLRWAVKPAKTESYIRASGAAKHQSRADVVCKVSRNAIDKTLGVPGLFQFDPARWDRALRIAGGDLRRPDRANERGSVRSACSYTPWMPAHLDYWPIRESGFMRHQGKSLGDLIDGRVVFIGTNFDAARDRTESPVHETLPGVFQYAMAFDNLLRFGSDRPSGVEPIFQGALGDFQPNWLDVVEVSIVLVVAGFGLVLRELLTPLRNRETYDGVSQLREQTWEPAFVLILAGIALWLLDKMLLWPGADVLIMATTFIVYDRDRLLEGIGQSCGIFVSLLNNVFARPAGAFVLGAFTLALAWLLWKYTIYAFAGLVLFIFVFWFLVVVISGIVTMNRPDVRRRRLQIWQPH